MLSLFFLLIFMAILNYVETLALKLWWYMPHQKLHMNLTSEQGILVNFMLVSARNW